MSAKSIRRARERLGLSQEEFARRLGVSRVTVTRWENGKRRPSRIAERAVRWTLASKDGPGWQDLAGAALTVLWDNPEDAIYDNWKAFYSPQAR